MPSAELVVVGGSAGSWDIVVQILAELPSDFSAAVAVVIHRPALGGNLAGSLDRCGALRARTAIDGFPLSPGQVLLAPPDYHLLIEDRCTVALSADSPVQFSRPSIDVLFDSAAAVFGAAVVAILLSGANADGSEGLAAILAAGGHGIIQAPESASAVEMPQAALELNPTATVAPPRDIVGLLRDLVCA